MNGMNCANCEMSAKMPQQMPMTPATHMPPDTIKQHMAAAVKQVNQQHGNKAK